jgi:hypothetical protein
LNFIYLECNRWLTGCPFCWVLKYKIKSKTVGVARQQLHFLCSDKENEAKESSLLAEGYIVRGAAATVIR